MAPGHPLGGCSRTAAERNDRGPPSARVPGAAPMPMDDVQVAEVAAQAAARALRELRDAGELSGRPLGDAGDAAAQQAIVAALAEHRPDDVVFSEEAVDDPRRL